MACNPCASPVNGMVFPDFVANGCCNPCCSGPAVGGVSQSGSCGCHHNCGCHHGCGCHHSCGGPVGGNVSGGSCSCSCDTGGCICTCD